MLRNYLRKHFLGIHIQLLDRLGDEGFIYLPFLGQRVQGGNDGEFGVHFEEATQALAGVAAAKAVGAESGEAAGNPRRDLVWDKLDVVGDSDEDARLVFEEGFEIRFLRRRGRMEHVPAFGGEGVVAEEFVAGGTPDVGGDAVFVGEDLLRAQRFADDRAGAEDVSAGRSAPVLGRSNTRITTRVRTV